MVRLALASAFLLTSVACGWVENVGPPVASVDAGNDDTVVTNPPPSNPSPSNPSPSNPPAVDPPAVAAYAVRWNPSTSPGVTGYELTVRNAVTASTRTIKIPLAAASSAGSNVLRYEINLETDHDHILSLRAYDATQKSAPSNQILVRAPVLIASVMAGMPSAALAGDSLNGSSASLAGSASSAHSPSTTAAGVGSGASSDTAGDANVRDASGLTASSDVLASIAFKGEGDHLEGAIYAAQGGVMNGFGVDAQAGTFAAWLRPVQGDSLRRVVASLAAGVDADFDRLELAIVDGGDVELTLRDDAGGIGYQGRFAAGLRADVWQHVALVVDPRADMPITLHVDGVLAPEYGASVGELGPTAPVGVLRIGAGSEGDSFAGQIGHVAIWSRALASDELLLASVRGHALDLLSDAMGAGLAHYWRLGEGDDVFELDQVGLDAPIDLAAVNGELAPVEDAPLALE